LWHKVLKLSVVSQASKGPLTVHIL
jgi:hypothetical protein